MKKVVYYILETGEENRRIKIRPVKHIMPGTNQQASGVFSLSEGKTDIGDIVFDDKMGQWEYTGMGNLTHAEAQKIADFIKSNQQAVN
jgi:hypothetical protein